MTLLRLLWKLLRALIHILQGYCTIKARFARLTQADREQRVHVWAQKMLAIMGITLVLRGSAPAAAPVLLVSNHLSWLDILVMHAARYCRFVSKSDVQTWPCIGILAAGAGTLFIERTSRRQTHLLVQQMAQCLEAGDVLALFPEGTTGNGIKLKPFHANLLQAAIDANVEVQPLSLTFCDAATGKTSFAPRYVDDDSLWHSIWNTFTAPPLRAVVTLGPAQFANHRSRSEWVQDLKSEIEVLRTSHLNDRTCLSA